jgi:hypothetical protein
MDLIKVCSRRAGGEAYLLYAATHESLLRLLDKITDRFQEKDGFNDKALRKK